jgi:predicted aspartyl protease
MGVLANPEQVTSAITMNVLVHIALSCGALLGAGSAHAADTLPLPRPSAPEPIDAGAVPAEADEPLFAVPTQRDRIGRILAPVMINGKGPFRLIIDTGANHSTVSPHMLEKLGLVPSPEDDRIVHGVTGSARVPAVLVDRLETGLFKVEQAYVPVIGTSMTADADGILGVAGLRKARVIVDFRHDKVSITRSRLRDEGGYLVIDARRMPDGVLAVDAYVRGVRARAIIDTGAERTLGNLALREAVRKKRREPGAPRSADVFGATPEVYRGEPVYARTIRLGRVTVSGVDIIYGDFPIFKSWDLDERPAMLIGMDILGVADTLVIDFARMQVRVRMNSGPYVHVN